MRLDLWLRAESPPKGPFLGKGKPDFRDWGKKKGSTVSGLEKYRGKETAEPKLPSGNNGHFVPGEPHMGSGETDHLSVTVDASIISDTNLQLLEDRDLLSTCTNLQPLENRDPLLGLPSISNINLTRV
ncbi:hypothetical protein QYF36_015497 [Acer negundo]|nr:hypothetical protein QYF36_015497 [Acer negundo]